MKDPVCGMELRPGGELREDHAGTTHYFRSSGCQSRFNKEPERYLGPDTPAGH
ncbi:MAG: YHS domain-containing protein [Planctomycetota bacterium]